MKVASSQPLIRCAINEIPVASPYCFDYGTNITQQQASSCMGYGVSVAKKMKMLQHQFKASTATATAAGTD